MTNLTKYSLVADVEAVSVTARAAANPNGAYYLAAEVDARIDNLTAEHDRLRAALNVFKRDSYYADSPYAHDLADAALKEQP